MFISRNIFACGNTNMYESIMEMEMNTLHRYAGSPPAPPSPSAPSSTALVQLL